MTASVEARALGGLWHAIVDLVPDLDRMGVDLVADEGDGRGLAALVATEEFALVLLAEEANG